MSLFVNAKWRNWHERFVVDQLRLARSILEIEGNDAYDMPAHQIQVLCRDCMEYCEAARPDLCAATQDTFGRGTTGLLWSRVCWETVARHRGHAVLREAESRFVDAGNAVRGPLTEPGTRFLCVNNLDDLAPGDRGAVLRRLHNLFPVPLACEIV